MQARQRLFSRSTLSAAGWMRRLLIRDALLNSRIQTVAFVNKRAISAGALIALATEKIVMGDGGTIGAATPVQMGAARRASAAGGGKNRFLREKRVSRHRRSAQAPPADRRSHGGRRRGDPGSDRKGKLLTLTTDEALKHKIAEFRADTMAEVLKQLGLAGAEVRRASPNWAENFVRFLTHPVVSSLLMTIGILGIILEIRTPGFGVPGVLGIGSLALFFWGHWLVQLAGWEEILLVVSGVVLLAAEIFVIPGFGVAGVLGIAALLSGPESEPHRRRRDVGFHTQSRRSSYFFSAARSDWKSWCCCAFYRDCRSASGLILETGACRRVRAMLRRPRRDRQLAGQRRHNGSPLRPSGIADVEGERVDVVSDGEFIEAGAEIVVSRVDGNRIVVRRHRP